MHPLENPGLSPAARCRVVAAIPARWGSTRLPGKALLELAGRPMVEHVWRRTVAAGGLERVVVLTDHERVAEVARGFGAEVELTPVECASGTDRIAWAARGWSCEAVINVQGDEPLIDPEGIGRVAAHLAAHPDDPVVTLATAAVAGDDDNPNAVKVVLDRSGRALYFSRAPIPYQRQPGGAALLRHLGIYGYRRETLLALAALEPTPLERSEALEQLRALEHGIPIRVLTGARPSWGVDTAADAAAVEARLTELSATGGFR